MSNNALNAASRQGRGVKWASTFGGPNSVLKGERQVVAARSRRAQVNNGHAGSAIDKYVSNLIGTGVVPRPEVEDEELKNQINALWNIFVTESDADGLLSFYGQQALAAMSVITSGEVLCRFRPRRASDSFVPLQLQLIEGDHLDGCIYKKMPNGNVVKDGIEFNRIGKRVAYHLLVNHPSDGDFANPRERVRVPVRNLLHVYKPIRVGQRRGLGWLCSILVMLYEIDAFEDAEAVRQKFNSLITAFIEDNGIEYEEEEGAATEEDDEDEDFLPDVEPGAQIPVPKGKKVTLNEPAKSDPNISGFLKAQFRKVASGIGLTYEQLTGDLSDVNFSSIRAGLIEFRRSCEMLLQQVFVHQLFRPVYNRFLETAILNDLLPITPAEYNANPHKYRVCSWQAPAWEWVDPLKGVLANKEKVRNGFSSRQKIAREYGNDVATIDRENKEDQERSQKNGVLYDSHTSHVQKNGSLQDYSKLIEDNNDE